MARKRQTNGNTGSPRRPNREARKSTMAWIRNFKQSSESSNRRLMEQLATEALPTSAPRDGMPMNLLILEGGGLRGYAHLGMLNGLLELNGGEDLIQYFDLVGGTSVGGVVACMMNHHAKMTPRNMDMARETLDDMLHTTFLRKRWRRLCSSWSLTDETSSPSSMYRRRYPGVQLYNERNVKAFALSAVKKTNSKEGTTDRSTKGNEKDIAGPFVFRTYDLPSDDERSGSPRVEVCPGTNQVLLWEAMAATSACPILTDRIRLDINGEEMRFADGGLIANNPLVVAMTEALHLWPHRPVRTVLVLSLYDQDLPTSILDAVNLIRQRSPDMTFLRLAPPISISALCETDVSRLDDAAMKAREFVLKSKDAAEAIKKIKESGARRWSEISSVDELRTSRSRRSSSLFSFLRRSHTVTASGRFVSGADVTEQTKLFQKDLNSVLGCNKFSYSMEVVA